MRGAVLWFHTAGVVVWFGAVAYYLLVLRPAVRASGIERRQWYLLLRAIKARLKVVVGGAILAIVTSGAWLAAQRSLWRWPPWEGGSAGRAFALKLALAAVLVTIYLTALPLIERMPEPRRRGKAFAWTHAAVLTLGAAAAFLGLLIHG